MNETILTTRIAWTLFLLWPATVMVRAEDWPMLGRHKSRNPVSPEKGAPVEWDVTTGRNIKWRAPLGSITLDGAVIADGLVWVGTNNQPPTVPGVKEDAPVLKCFRESDGKPVWQFATLPGNGVPRGFGCLGFHSSPLIENGRAWLTTRYGQVHCLDVSPLREGSAEPKPVWTLNMIQSLGVAPFYHVMSDGRTCSIGASWHDRIYVITGNGIIGSLDGRGKYSEAVRSPEAPSLVCLDRNSGKVLWRDNSPGGDILWGQWGSPLVAEMGGRVQVVAPMGDGWLRSFDALTGELLWKLNINLHPVIKRHDKNHFLNAPVLYQDRIYIGGGNDWEMGEGPGSLFCIDPGRRGDVSHELEDGPGKVRPNPNSAVLWHLPSFGRTIGLAAVHDGLVIAAGYDGNVHCLDAKTGHPYWRHDLKGHVYASPLIVDGKIYVGTEECEMFVFALSREKSLLFTNDLGRSVYASPIFANGVLYIAIEGALLAIQPGASSPPPPKPAKPVKR